MVSGTVFVTILKLVMGIPMNVFLYGILPAVVLVAVGNAIITPFLYFPALRLFESMHYMAVTEEKDSDHGDLTLVQQQPGVVSVEHLTYTYPFSEKPALSDVSLQIENNDFVVVTGPNGAGKTTLLMSMIGAVPHYFGGTMNGMVFTDGHATTQTNIADLASSIGVILADYGAQIVTMTVGRKWHSLWKIMDSRLRKLQNGRKKHWLRSIWMDWRSGRFPLCPAGSGRDWPLRRFWQKSRRCWFLMSRRLRWTRKASVISMNW